MLVLADWLVTAADEAPRRRWGVRVVGDRVAAVGPHSDLRTAHPDDEVVDAGGHVVLPGFVDSHMHLYGVLAHGIPADSAPTGFWSFLADHWWPKVEDRLDHDMIAAGAEWGAAALLATGTTTVFDVLEAPWALPDALLAEKEVMERRGMRAVLGFEATERVSPENAAAGLAENVALITAARGSALVSGMMCYHTTFTCSDDLVRRAFELAEEHDVGCHAHVNEGAHEPEWCLRRHGRRTVEHYDHLGVAGPRMLASQVVHLSESERRIIAERGVRCAHMPLSNCEVGGGIAPVPELLDAGVTVGLGSDGYLTDMYQVMRGAFLVHKARLFDPGVMPAARVLAMATEGGGRALGLDRVGRLEPGWAADLQVVDARFPTPAAEHNLVEQLVLWRSGQDVRHVMVGGEWRVWKGEVLEVDLEALRARVHHQARRLWEAA